jgi:hypothetical protein
MTVYFFNKKSLPIPFSVIQRVVFMKSANCPELPLHQIVITSLPADVLEQIDHLARSTDRSRAAMSRVLLVTALAAYEMKTPTAKPTAATRVEA